METNVTTAGKKQEAPVMDFRNIGARSIESLTEEELRPLGKQLLEKVKVCGFVAFKNHGLPLQFVSNLHDSCRTFFSLSQEEKAINLRSLETFQGYTDGNFEKLDTRGVGVFDQKETFDFINLENPFPEKVPEMKEAAKEGFEVLWPFVNKLFRILEYGFDVEPNTLKNMHKKHPNDLTTLRVLQYPPVPNSSLGSVRCGEHKDISTFSIQIQSTIGGFQVFHDGQWKNADGDPEMISFFFGESMEILTADEQSAALHRVVVTDEEIQGHQTRDSVVFFVHVDGDVILQPLNGSTSYQPISSKEFYVKKLSLFYQ